VWNMHQSSCSALDVYANELFVKVCYPFAYENPSISLDGKRARTRGDHMHTNELFGKESSLPFCI
jgi:hypothetical protein